MTKKVRAKILYKMALENGAEFIRSHVEHGGISEDDIDGHSLEEYEAQCIKVYDLLMKKARKI